MSLSVTFNNTLIGLGLIASVFNFSQSKPVLGTVSALPSMGLIVLSQTYKNRKNILEELLRKSKIELNSTKSSLSIIEDELKALKTKYQLSINRTKTLENEISNLNQKLDFTNNSLRVSSEKITGLEEQYQILQREKTQLLSQLEASENTSNALAKEVARCYQEIEEYKEALEKASETIEAIKFDEYQLDEYRRTKYELEARIAHFEADKKVFEMSIGNLTDKLEGATSEYEELKNRYELDIEKAFQTGLQTQLERDKSRLAQLELENQTLSLKVHGKKALEAMQSQLKSVAEMLTTDYRPIVACGEPRSGKAQIVLTAMQALAGSTGVIPIIYDKSEGGNISGTWYRAGVPSFKDFNLFINCLRSISQNGGKRPILHEKESEVLAPIFIVFDESRTALNGVEKETVEEFVELFNEMKFEMVKHKIFLCVISCSYQIQNLRAGNAQLYNGGDLENIHLFLNNQNVTKFYRDKCEKFEQTDEWLSLSKNLYISAYVDTSDSNIRIIPIKHPTHNGNKRSEKIASNPIENIKLAEIESQAKWLPLEFRNLHKSMTKSRNTQDLSAIDTQSDKDSEELEALQRKVIATCDNQNAPSQTSTNGVWNIDSIHCDNIPLELWQSIAESKENQTQTILNLFGIKASGRNKRYQKAREIYQKVKSRG